MHRDHAWTFLLLSGWIVAVAIIHIVALPLTEDCETPGGNAGQCVPARSCPFIRDLIRNVTTLADLGYLDQFHCGRKINGRSLVCCPELQNEPDCGRITFETKTLGGAVETEIDAYPWTALLAYQNERGNISFGCGGTLIRDRFIVTAAHCIDSIGKQKLTFVRLGEWDLSTAHDCDEVRCHEFRHQDFSVSKVIKHEDYNNLRKNREHDIALLKLSTIGTDSIAPICLPTVDIIQSLNVEREVFDVAGWGATETREHLMQRKWHATLSGKSLDVCHSVYSKARLTFTKNQLCVGGDDLKDSCRGDSGGPLMILRNNHWHLAGVASLEPPQCGTKAMPRIYTNIGNYLDWLAGKIELESQP